MMLILIFLVVLVLITVLLVKEPFNEETTTEAPFTYYTQVKRSLSCLFLVGIWNTRKNNIQGISTCDGQFGQYGQHERHHERCIIKGNKSRKGTLPHRYQRHIIPSKPRGGLDDVLGRLQSMSENCSALSKSDPISSPALLQQWQKSPI